jgi:hypothetical protein
MELYSQILDNAGPALSAILRHIRDYSSEAFLFHCTGWYIVSDYAFVVVPHIICSRKGPNRRDCCYHSQGKFTVIRS